MSSWYCQLSAMMIHHINITDMRQHRFNVEFSNTSCCQRNVVIFFVVGWVLNRYLDTTYCSLCSRSTELWTQSTSVEDKLRDNFFRGDFVRHRTIAIVSPLRENNNAQFQLFCATFSISVKCIQISLVLFATSSLFRCPLICIGLQAVSATNVHWLRCVYAPIIIQSTKAEPCGNCVVENVLIFPLRFHFLFLSVTAVLKILGRS